VVADHGFNLAWTTIANTRGTTRKITRVCAVVTGRYCTQLNAKGSTLHTGTQQLQRYITFTVVHNIHSGAQHIHYTETFGLLEGQVISVYISVLGVVVRSAKKHMLMLRQNKP